MFGLGTGELILIGIVAIIFLGPRRIPQLGASLAKGIRNFKKGMSESREEISQDDNK